MKTYLSGWKARPTIGDLSMNMHRWLALASLLGLAVVASSIPAACCYFSAKNADILQPAQKAYLTWDPDEKKETFTVQPKFEGNALDFGMVIPTPTQPRLHEMPRDFFKHLAVYTIMKHRQFPASKLLPQEDDRVTAFAAFGALAERADAKAEKSKEARPPAIKVLEAGVVG